MLFVFLSDISTYITDNKIVDLVLVLRRQLGVKYVTKSYSFIRDTFNCYQSV